MNREELEGEIIKGVVTMSGVRMMFAFVMAAVLLPVMAADLRVRFDWRNKDGKCFVTPVKTQTGSKDRSYAYAPMDCLESMRLIQKGKDYNSLTEEEKIVAVGPVELAAADAEPRIGYPISCVNADHYPTAFKSCDWLLRKGMDDRLVVTFGFSLPIIGGYSGSYKIGSDRWRKWIEWNKHRLIERGPLISGCQLVARYFNGNYYYFPDGIYTTGIDGPDYFYTVCIVGYDDTIPSSSFNANGKVPNENGAWIVKGSYGPEFCNDGYFYISYCDGRLLNSSIVCLGAFDTSLDMDAKYGKLYCHGAEMPTGGSNLQMTHS